MIKITVRHHHEVIASITTNHSLSIEEAMAVAGVDIDERDGENFRYDYEDLIIETETDFQRRKL